MGTLGFSGLPQNGGTNGDKTQTPQPGENPVTVAPKTSGNTQDQMNGELREYPWFSKVKIPPNNETPTQGGSNGDEITTQQEGESDWARPSVPPLGNGEAGEIEPELLNLVEEIIYSPK